MLLTPRDFAPSHVAPAPLAGTALAFAFAQSRLLTCGDERSPTVPLLAELEHAGLAGERHYLGRLDGTDCVAVTLPDDAVAPAGCTLSGLRSLFLRMPDPLLAIAARAFQVVEWD